jgi:teichuronic acid biosynthesis glycosyltransferase TuaC
MIPNIFYIIVGGTSVEGDWEPKLRKMVRDLGLESNVLFSGMRPHDELFKWLSASDVFCLATSNEGWANVFLEAMACGLPVVTTRVGGNEEVISSEDYGVLFDLGDEKQMIEAIKSAIVRDWDSDKIISYARANTWDRRVEQLLEEFRELTGITDITGNQKGINNKDHYASETQKTPNAL